MFRSKALEPIHGQETTTSRYEHALRTFKAGDTVTTPAETLKAGPPKPAIVWFEGRAYIKGTEPKPTHR